jgi:ankyrin repeat protein
MIDFLSAAGAGVSGGRSGDGVTPLAVAAGVDATDAVEALLGAGADPTVASVSGVTPLLEAAEHGFWKAGRSLLAHSSAADPDYALPDGTTALIIAAEAGSSQFVQLMLAVSVDVCPCQTVTCSALGCCQHQ